MDETLKQNIPKVMKAHNMVMCVNRVLWPSVVYYSMSDGYDYENSNPTKLSRGSPLKVVGK